MSIAPLTPAEQDAALRARLAVSERALKALARRAATLAAPLPAAGDEQAPAEDAEERRALQRTRLAIDTQQFLGTLARASRVAESTAAQEMAAYEAELLAIEEEERANEVRIEELKQELQEAKKDRENKLVYDAVVSEMGSMGARDETLAQLDTLRAQIAALEAQVAATSELGTSSRVDFSALISSLSTISDSLGANCAAEAEEEESEPDSASEAGEEEEEERESASGSNAKGGASAAASSSGRRADRERERERTERHLDPKAPSFRPSLSRTASTRLDGAATPTASSQAAASAATGATSAGEKRKRAGPPERAAGVAAAIAAVRGRTAPGAARERGARGKRGRESSAEEGEAAEEGEM